MHKPGCKAFLSKFNRFVRHYFNKLESLVVEPGHEFVLLKSAQDDNVGLEGIAVVGRTVMDIYVRLIGMSVGSGSFRMDKPHPGASFSPDPYF